MAKEQAMDGLPNRRNVTIKSRVNQSGRDSLTQLE
jgi:hypothetical protein